MPASPETFVWYELMTTDLAAADTFYRAVLGWISEDWDGPGPGYKIMSAAGLPAAGLMPLPPEAGSQPLWLGHIGTADLEAATEGVSQAGGAVHRPPADIPGIGRFSVVADPQGAVFQLFEPSRPDDRAPPMTPGHVAWRELHTTDWASAFAFYAGRFGWVKGDALDMGPMGTYQIISDGELQIGGVMNKAADVQKPVWLFYFAVADIDAGASRVEEAGGRVTDGPMPVPGGAFVVQCTDPQGAQFALVGMRP
jgi:predicted enzyme related to lactoylglutathione lyase